MRFKTYKLTNPIGIESVWHAISNWYRLIDTAYIYDNALAISKDIKERGISRDNLFMNTTLWRENLWHQSTNTELIKSLKKLNLEYINLYLIPWPDNEKRISKKQMQILGKKWKNYTSKVKLDP